MELQHLHDKAIFYATTNNRYPDNETLYFYRNNTEAYFEMCKEKYNNTMKVNLKDYNGDAASVINGQVKGIFFCANPDRNTKRPPDQSYFGPERICVKALDMLTNRVNIYFADFFCYPGRDAHYVTLVMSEQDSEADRFCREKQLIKLGPRENPFLYIKTTGGTDAVFASSKVWVEVLYTEDFPLPED